MKKLFSILMFSFLALNLIAQEFEVPKNYVLKQKEDFSKYESEVLKGIDWLLQIPINSQPEKRKEVNMFIMSWLEGSPTVSVEIKQEIVSFMKPNPDLLMIFMCGWTRYSLESKDYNNKVKGNQKGVEAVIEFYIKNKENLKKDKNVEKYIKLKEEGKLEDYITKNA
ncbi:MAG: hypothetical protein PHT07_14455 [Paludibacter sp.]|nr:hypothetical protein [Paludibacter sp.]